MTSRESIRMASEFFEVPFNWGFLKRLEYLQDLSDQVSDRIAGLIGLRTECRGAETILCDREIDIWLRAFSRVQSIIKDLKYPNRKQNGNGVTDQMIEAARSHDITELLEEQPRRGMIHCINPEHEDEHPSASIKNNRIHCFVCNESWDPIAYIMKTQNTDFIRAVKFLN